MRASFSWELFRPLELPAVDHAECEDTVWAVVALKERDLKVFEESIALQIN
jgi:hypothetical protein